MPVKPVGQSAANSNLVVLSYIGKSSSTSSLTVKVTKIFFFTLALAGATAAALACAQYLQAYAFWAGTGSFMVSTVTLAVLFIKNNTVRELKHHTPIEPIKPPEPKKIEEVVLSEEERLKKEIEEQEKEKRAAKLFQDQKKQQVALFNKDCKEKYEKESALIANGQTVEDNVFKLLTPQLENNTTFQGLLFRIFSFIPYRKLLKFASINKQWSKWIKNEGVLEPRFKNEYQSYPCLHLCSSKEPNKITYPLYLKASQVRFTSLYISPKTRLVVKEKHYFNQQINHYSVLGQNNYFCFNQGFQLVHNGSIERSITNIKPTIAPIPYQESKAIVVSNRQLIIINIQQLQENNKCIETSYSLINRPSILAIASLSQSTFVLATSTFLHLVDYTNVIDLANIPQFSYSGPTPLNSIQLFTYHNAVFEKGLSLIPSIISIEHRKIQQTLNATDPLTEINMTSICKWHHNSTAQAKEQLKVLKTIDINVHISVFTLLGCTHILYAVNENVDRNDRKSKLVLVDIDSEMSTTLLEEWSKTQVNSLLWLGESYIAISYSHLNSYNSPINAISILNLDLHNNVTKEISSKNASHLTLKSVNTSSPVYKLAKVPGENFYGLTSTHGNTQNTLISVSAAEN